MSQVTGGLTHRLVHLVAGSLSMSLLSEGNESESSGAASLSIDHNVGLLNLTELGESLQRSLNPRQADYSGNLKNRLTPREGCRCP